MTMHVEDQSLTARSTASGTASRKLDSRLSRLAARLSDTPCPFALELPDGRRTTFGTGPPRFRVLLKDVRTLATLASLDEGQIAEAYMAGDIDIEGDFVAMMDLRASLSDRHYLSRAWRFLQPLFFGQVGTNARAIAVHYDLDAEFYLSFLGETGCYTQGIFASDDEPLHVAIHRKFDTCIADCGLKPGSRVLEVGPGWGAFPAYAAEKGIRITGVTNSIKSQEYMKALGERLGLEWDIVLGDFLDFTSERRFDAIVMMGIMEHLPDYPRVVRKLTELLEPGGRVYLDASAAREKYTASSFIYRNIYRGNHSFLDLADFLAAVAQSPFQLRSVHEDQHSYFLTFKHWSENFEANRERVVQRFGERNFRRFQLYLWGSAHRFLTDGLQCYRVVLEKPA
jgi:cyclopropane-fatty-acyl-phospholipid synthase